MIATCCPSISKLGRVEEACALRPTRVEKVHKQKKSAHNTKMKKNCEHVCG